MNPDQVASSKPQDKEFIRLFLQHEPVLRAYARTMLPDWNSIDDALQEASVTMWQKLDQLKNEDGFLPWARVIVRYKCLQAIDRVRRERPLLNEAVLNLLADEAEVFTDIDHYTQLKTALGECMAELSSARQELLLAPYGAVGSVQQLADGTGKTPNSLYKLLGRLRAKLAICVQEKLRIVGA